MSKLSDLLASLHSDVEYWSEVPVHDFTEQLNRLLEERNMSRSELADEVGCQKSYITKLLGGNANFTVETMTKFARIFDRVVRVYLAPEGAEVRYTPHWTANSEFPLANSPRAQNLSSGSGDTVVTLVHG